MTTAQSPRRNIFAGAGQVALKSTQIEGEDKATKGIQLLGSISSEVSEPMGFFTSVLRGSDFWKGGVEKKKAKGTFL